MSSAIQSQNTTLIDFLLAYGEEKGISWNLDRALKSATHMTVENQAVEYAKIIKEKGGNVNFIDELGNTVLHNAARSLHENLCSWLIDSGADPDATNYGKYSARELIDLISRKRSAVRNEPVLASTASCCI